VTGEVQAATAAKGLAEVVKGVGEVGGGCHIFSGCGFPAPGLQNFDFKPIFSVGSFHFTKPMLIVILCMIAVLVFFGAAFWRPKLVPRGVQNLAEIGILQVRDQILRPALGRRGDSYLPFLVSLFFFIWFCNLMELIPFFQFPAMSRIGFVWPLVAIVYILYLYLGFRHQGAWGYIRNMIPPDVPLFVLPILIPVELARFFIIQPFTLGVRLFGNMFAGHLLLTIFAIATWYLASLSIGLIYAVGSAVLVVFVFLLELLIDLLQAFIFTTLTATYIAASLEPQH
jgi:F-type H+-transporting ATPase subunit a